jgi:CubicO group peptidase (beta-lactamase class C family)
MLRMRLATMILASGAWLSGLAGAAPPRDAQVSVPAPAPLPTPTLPPAGAPLTAADLDAWLDGYLPYALHTGDIAGAVVAVVKEGQIVSERGYGFADVEKRTPVDPHTTLFRPGSVSKLVTWTAVMQLVEQGKIDLDTDVNRYLDFTIPAREGKPVTMRNLMQHTAGFEEQAKGIITEDAQGPNYVTLLKQWVPERVFAPGTTPAYSNYGASLAGYIVQRLSGESFDDYVERHIFAPLDMPRSTFRQPLPASLAPLMSKGYILASEKPHPFEIVGPAPAGAMSAPAEDMAHFMIAHLNDGEYNGKRILSAKTAELMHDSPLTMLPPLNRMELGFFETNINGREVIAHLGDTELFHTSLHLFLREKVGLYVSFNSLGKDAAVQGLRTALFSDFADRYFPASAPPAPPLDAKTAAHDAALMSGTWVNSRGSQSSFLSVLALIGQTKLGVNPDGTLLTPFHGLNGKPRHWIEIAPFVWRAQEDHERLAAKVVDGRPVRFSIDLLSAFMVFERPPWYRDSAWLAPWLYASLTALTLTALLWPITAIVRRHYRARLVLDRPALAAFRASKLGALALTLAMGLWAILIGVMIKDNTALSDTFDWALRSVQVVSALAFLGGTLAILWNVRAVWRGRRRWPARVWSLVLAVSAAAVLWVAIAFHLLGFGIYY